MSAVAVLVEGAICIGGEDKLSSVCPHGQVEYEQAASYQHEAYAHHWHCPLAECLPEWLLS